MPINPISTSNTFGQWVAVTSQLITISNALNDNGFFNTNSTIVVSGTGVLNVRGTALVNTLLSNTINTRVINVTGSGEALNVANSANVGGNVFVTGNVSIGNLVVRGAVNIDVPTFTNLILPGYANVAANLSVGANIVQTGPQTSSFAGRLNLNNTEISLAASGNVIFSKNVSVTSNVVVGQNLVASRIFGTTANITSLNVSTLNVGSYVNVSGNVNITGTINASNLIITNNLTVTNLTVTSNIVTQSTTNITGGNVIVSGVVNTRNLIVTGSVLGDLNVDTGNLIIRQARNISPGSPGNGFVRLIGTDYTGYVTLDGSAMRVGHNSSARHLSLEVNETSRLNIDSSNVVITGGLNVSGIINGDASGLTNVNFLASQEDSTSVLLFNGHPGGFADGGASGRTPNWVNTGITLTTTIPPGIDTVDLTISASLLIESIGLSGWFTEAAIVGGPVTISGSFGTSGGSGTFSTGYLSTVLSSDLAYGAGSPDFRYRVLRRSGGSDTVFYTSEWTQLSTPGSFFGVLNTVRDTAPINTAPTQYVVEGQWRNAENIDEAKAGTVNFALNQYQIYGIGTNWQAYLSARSRIKIGTNVYYVSEVIYPTVLRVQNPAVANVAGLSYTVEDPNTIPRVRLLRKTINLTGYRT